MEELIIKAVRKIIEARKAVALTGAGISAESGIPTFRDKGGLWDRYDPEEYATIQAFQENPAKVWTMLEEFMEMKKAKPNPGHFGLAELEKMGHLRAIITQNVDNLHQEAGNAEVIEFHGNFRRAICLKCGSRYKMSEISLEKLPPRCSCGNALKPDAVFFGEPITPLTLQRAQEISQNCDLMLVIGTSAVVYPAASMPEIAKQAGAKIIEINPEKTYLSDYISDYFIKGLSGKILPIIVDEIKRMAKEN